MKKAVKFALGSMALLLLLVAVAVAVVEYRYQVFFPSPRIPVSELNSTNACVIVSLKPQLAPPALQDIIAAQVKTSTRALGYLLPQEIAALFSVDVAAEELHTTVYINDQRLGPVIASKADTTWLHQQFPNVRWATPNLNRPRKGVLTLEGKGVLDTTATETLHRRWPTPQPLQALAAKMGNNHLLEIALDNQAGGVYATLSQALIAANVPNGLFPPQQVELVVGGITSGYMYIDPSGTDAYTLLIHLECDPATAADTTRSLQSLLGMAQIGLQMMLKEQYNVGLTGSAGVQGNIVEGKYTLNNVSALYNRSGRELGCTSCAADSAGST